MDMIVKWYAELTEEEMKALIEYHQTSQYCSARKEEYSDAEYYKNRAGEWKARLGKNLKVVEEAS